VIILVVALVAVGALIVGQAVMLAKEFDYQRQEVKKRNQKK